MESAKTVAFVKTTSQSEVSGGLLRDLYALKKPDAVLLNKKNDIHPFENSSSIEFLAQKNNAPLFISAHHSKKRPNSLVFTRLFDNQVIDMSEAQILDYIPAEIFDYKPGIGMKPSMVFIGDLWNTSDKYKNFANVLVDVFRGQVTEAVDLKGLDHVLSFTISPDETIYFRAYGIVLKKSGTKLPKVELTEMGPFFNMKLTRSIEADPELRQKAFKVQNKIKKQKNVERDIIGDKIGRIHMKRQDLDTMQTRKMKGLKRRRNEAEEETEE